MKRGNENTRDIDDMLKSLFIYTGLLLLVTVLLISIGLIMIASTTSTSVGMFFFNRQLIWIGVGLVGGVIIARIPPAFLVKYSHIFLIVLCIALTYLFLLRFIDKVCGSEIATKLPLCPSEIVNGKLRGGIKGGFRWLVCEFESK